MRARGTRHATSSPPRSRGCRQAARRPCSAATSEPPDPRPDGGSIALCLDHYDRPAGLQKALQNLARLRDRSGPPCRAHARPTATSHRSKTTAQRRSARASHSLTRIKGSHVSAVSRCLPLPLCLVSAGPINTAQDRSAG
jgi:hypothetical protein